MEHKVEIRFKEDSLVKDLFLNGNSEGFIMLDHASNSSAKLERVKKFRSIDYNQILEILLTMGSSVSASIIARWLYDKLLGKKVRLLVNNHDVEISEEAISRALLDAVRGSGTDNPG